MKRLEPKRKYAQFSTHLDIKNCLSRIWIRVRSVTRLRMIRRRFAATISGPLLYRNNLLMIIQRRNITLYILIKELLKAFLFV